MKKSLKSLVVFTILFSLVINMLSPYFVSLAEEDPDIPDLGDYIDPCKPEDIVFAKSIRLWNLDIRRTVDNFITASAISLISVVLGVSPNALMACQAYTRSQLMNAFGFKIGGGGEGSKLFTGTYDATVEACDDKGWAENMCGSLANDIGGAGETMAFNGQGMPTSVEVASINSSMLGISYRLENFARREPLPVNLAFYWDQSISKIPVVNKALAAPNDTYKSLPILYAVYYIWQWTRNVSLALIAVVLLYTGILIIMRKKVNPQVVVSVQYAIPKIIIGLGLILFSYPIGALIVSVSWGLFRGAFPLIFKSILGSSQPIPFGIVLLSILLEMLNLTSGSSFLILLIWVTALALVILQLVLYFKALLIYVKMVFSIMIAPLELVLGTIPGSEERIKEWFKKMAKYGITIVAMGMVIPVTLLIAFAVVVAYNSTGGSAEMGGWGNMMAILGPCGVIFVGFSIALGMEKRIDTMFFGGKK